MATLLEDFDVLSEWTLGGTAPSGIAETTDTTGVYQSTKSLRFTLNNTTQDKYITKQVNWNLSGDDTLVMLVYNHRKYGGSAIGLQLYLANSTNMTGDTCLSTWSGDFAPGWNVFYFKQAGFAKYNSFTFASAIQSIRLKIYGSSGILRDFTVDSLWKGVHGRPKLVMGFDDGFSDHYTAHQYAVTKGIPMTHYLEGSVIDTASYLTSAQVDEMALAGDAICCHDGAQWDGSDGDSGQMMSGEKAALRALGHIANHASFPQGRYGQYDSDGADINKSHLMNARARFLSCRGTNTGVNLAIPEIANWYGGLRAHPLNNTCSLQQAKDYVDDLIRIGACGAFYGHLFGTADLTHWPLADFQALCDYIATLNASIDCVTISEMYRTIQGEIDAFARSSSIIPSLLGSVVSTG